MESGLYIDWINLQAFIPNIVLPKKIFLIQHDGCTIYTLGILNRADCDEYQMKTVIQYNALQCTYLHSISSPFMCTCAKAQLGQRGRSSYTFKMYSPLPKPWFSLKKIMVMTTYYNIKLFFFLKSYLSLKNFKSFSIYFPIDRQHPIWKEKIVF